MDYYVFVFQRVLHSAGGWEVQVRVRSRRTGVGLCQAAASVPVVCRTTVWTQITTATVMLTTTNGTVFTVKMCADMLPENAAEVKSINNCIIVCIMYHDSSEWVITYYTMVTYQRQEEKVCLTCHSAVFVAIQTHV